MAYYGFYYGSGGGAGAGEDGLGLLQFSRPEIDKLELINRTASSASLVGTLFILFCYWKFVELRSFAFRLIFHMSLADLMFGVANVMGDMGGDRDGGGASSGTPSAGCVTQALLLSYSGLSSMLWSASIAFTLWRALLVGDPAYSGEAVERKFKWYNLVCWGWPIPVTLLPLATESYGSTGGGWCWIKNDNAKESRSVQVLWMFLQLYILLWATLIFNLTTYYGVHKHFSELQRRRADSELSSGQQLTNRIKYYPLVLLVCWLPSTVNVGYVIARKEDFVLRCFSAFFAALMPLFNSMVYGLTPEVRQCVREFLGGGRPEEVTDSFRAYEQSWLRARRRGLPGGSHEGSWMGPGAGAIGGDGGDDGLAGGDPVAAAASAADAGTVFVGSFDHFTPGAATPVPGLAPFLPAQPRPAPPQEFVDPEAPGGGEASGGGDMSWGAYDAENVIGDEDDEFAVADEDDD